MASQNFSLVILAAGKATRFKSERSKILHTLAGQPLGEHILRAARAVGPDQALMVIGHSAEEVRKVFARPELTFIEQKDQLGTGHALIIARPELEHCPSPIIVVLVGDAPLLRAETLRGLIDAHARSRAAATVLTTVVDDPTGYGRVIAKKVGGAGAGRRFVRAIVEEKVATAAEKKVREINSGIICFSRVKLLKHLGELSAENAQKEYLLTDLVQIFNRHGEKVMAFPVADSREVLGVNDRMELAQVEKILRLRKARALAHDGVTIVNPEATYIDQDVEVGADTVVDPGVSLLGRTRVGRACTLRAYSTINDSVLGDRVSVRPYSVISGCEIRSDATIGPFAHLRDGAVIEQQARIGNFVEVKKSYVGRGSKASHLTYLGDATLGTNVNVGAGTVTCNYDGEKKHSTIIEDGSFIGSGSMLVAPVRIGKGSTVAAGSAITEDVPRDSLAVGRARQVNKEGWSRTRRQPALAEAIAVRETGTVIILDLSGRLTIGESAAALHNKIVETLEAGRKQVLVNLAKVDYVDSTAMGELVRAMKSLRNSGGDLKLSSIPEPVLSLLEAANLHRVFEIHVREDAALASFGQNPPASRTP
jgi:bifunctional UDP-N-acetylglucosamine pyrophosphorylase/glucosamine-1-phosphate N-acetyltransferase